MDIDIALVMMALIGCYLIGSIPEAWLIARLATGKDLRHLGSGNLGVTNTALSVARWAGLLVFLLEIMKGVAAVYFVRTIGGSEYLLMAGVVATVAGARWSIWLRGAGGRANTCGVAALFLINWQIPIGFLLFWTPLRLVTRSSFKATRIC